MYLIYSFYISKVGLLNSTIKCTKQIKNLSVLRDTQNSNYLKNPKMLYVHKPQVKQSRMFLLKNYASSSTILLGYHTCL